MGTEALPRLLRAVTLLVVVAVSGCADLERVRVDADRFAAQAGLERTELSAGAFRLLSYQRSEPSNGGNLHIYIEGDGRAWPNRYRPPSNPTPLDSVALRLAVRDRSDNVVYLARPCQYLSPGPECDARWWTTHRYSEAVVGAMNAVVDIVKAQHHGRDITLIGHSGGGVIAAVLAARRSDVSALITVASPLSLDAWTSALELSALPHCINPAHYAQQLASIPQVHLVGSGDEIVPISVVNDFMRRLPEGHQATVIVMPDADHRCCWDGALSQVMKTRFTR